MLFEMLLDELRQDIGQITDDEQRHCADIYLTANFAYQARLRNWSRPKFSPEIGCKYYSRTYILWLRALSKTAFTPNDTATRFFPPDGDYYWSKHGR